MERDYTIQSEQLGKDRHSKVYRIKHNHTNRELIVKIYENSKLSFYQNETNILNILNNNYANQDNAFYIMYKDLHYYQNMFILPEEVKGTNHEFLFYDYLPKLSLLEYLSLIGERIKETHTKYLCYILLNSIDKLHKINICHNKIDISNIMLDNKYNPKIIHFSEAKTIINKNILNNDLFGLGQLLAKIISLGKFNSIGYSKKNKDYIIYYDYNGKNIQVQESKFWDMISYTYDIDISKQFLNFFHILIEAKKSKDLVNINELLKNEWLNEISKNEIKYDIDFKNDFNKLYETIIEDNEKKNLMEIDIDDIFEKKKVSFSSSSSSSDKLKIRPVKYEYVEKDELMLNEAALSDEEESSDDERVCRKKKSSKKKISSDEEEDIKKTKKKEDYSEKESSAEVEQSSEEESSDDESVYRNRKSREKKISSDEEEDIKQKEKLDYSEEEPASDKSVDQIESEDEDLDSRDIYAQNDNLDSSSDGERKDKTSAGLKKKISEKEKLYKDSYQKKEIVKSAAIKKNIEDNLELSKYDLERKDKEELQKIESECSPNLEDEKELKSKHEEKMISLKEIINIHKQIEFNKKENLYKPKKDDFNYLKININNKKNKDINKAINNFMNIFKIKIEKKYMRKEIEMKCVDEKDMSFTIYLEIPPKYISYDDIEFLDENFGKKIINVQTFKIKVELVEGDKSLFVNDKINQYYLVFNPVSIEKEDFYRQLKILKKIAKNLLLVNDIDERD